MMTRWYGSVGLKHSLWSWTPLHNKRKQIVLTGTYIKGRLSSHCLGKESAQTPKWTVSVKLSLRLRLISVGDFNTVLLLMCVCVCGSKSRPSLANPLPSATDGRRRRDCSVAATAGLGSAGNDSSPVRVSVCTKSRRGHMFFFSFFFFQLSTCQKLYHYPKKENVFGSVGGPRLCTRTSCNDRRFIKAASVSACCASICLFHSGFFLINYYYYFF